MNDRAGAPGDGTDGWARPADAGTPAPGAAAPVPALSVVMPTYRRPALLRRCLEALQAQTVPAAEFEIVVVDDARCDDTRRLVAECARRHPAGPALTYLRPAPGRSGPAAARNAGWRAASGALIAFTDDDTIPDPHWLAEGRKALRPAVDAAWGKVVVPLPEQPTDWERNTARLAGAGFVTANCFVRRAALARVGGFDERFRRPWREDSDLYFSLLEQGCRVICAPAAVVLHPARAAPPGNCLRQHRNMYFDALLYKKHRVLYRAKIASGPPLDYYATVGALGLAVSAGLAGLAPVALAAGGTWLWLSARLAQRRLAGTSRAWAQRAEVVLTSLAIPPLAVYWRLAGALHFRVPFA